MIVRAAERMRHLEQVSQDSRWLKGLERVLYDIGILRDNTDKIHSMRFGEQGEIGGGEFGSGEVDFAGDGAETGVGVLEVWASVALEGCHGLDVEGIVVDSECCQ